MRLGGEVDDHVGLLDQRIDQGRIADIPIPEAPARMLAVQHLLRQVFDAASVGQSVDNYDPVFGIICGKAIEQVRTNEPGAAGNENSAHNEPH
jgi:hypothetical protein